MKSLHIPFVLFITSLSLGVSPVGAHSYSGYGWHTPHIVETTNFSKPKTTPAPAQAVSGCPLLAHALAIQTDAAHNTKNLLDGPSHPVDSTRDGSHDFDFTIGTWHTHIKRLVNPLSGSNDWVELNGTVVTRKVWNGKAQLEEIEADGPNGHFEGLNLFLYNPTAHQWGLYWASSNDGVIGVPGIGSFKNGIGEMYDQETYNGKTILVRGIWSEIKDHSHKFEQAFSADGGKTWETNFIAEKTFISAEPAILAQPVSESNISHDFDFDYGTWNMNIQRQRHPLTDSASWYTMKGVTKVTKVFGGKGNLAEVEADGPYGHLELLALRLYNPIAHQWSIYFATSGVGVLGTPSTGEFTNGVGEFIDKDAYNDRSILVHFQIQALTPTSARSQQAFSGDGGKTWQTNWINNYTKVDN